MEKDYFKGLTRKEYIQKVHEIIQKDGLKDISIRQIAKELGCSSAALYRYFNSKNELLYYINLSMLENYIIRLNRAEKDWTNPWDIYVGVWDCYCREAFVHPKAFNMLYFEDNNLQLSGAIHEYYQMFPENIGNTNQFFLEMLKTSDFLERDFEMCKKCVEAGVISYENAVKLNRLCCMLYKGYFKSVYDNEVPEDKIDDYIRLFISDLDTIVRTLASDLQGYQGYHRKSK